MDPIMALAAKHGLPVVEDCAQVCPAPSTVVWRTIPRACATRAGGSHIAITYQDIVFAECIEGRAQAHGARYKGRIVGTIGAAGGGAVQAPLDLII